ncbi:MAG: hypothetical protein ABI537_03195 [Casimicrobiaceae bacterium]
MNNVNPSTAAWRPEYVTDVPAGTEASASGVSWAAVLAGGFVAAALALILALLGAGLGLASISPWAGAGITATKLGIWAIVWLAATQLIAYGMGGYLAGRLRTKWSALHDDEVYFRDTAHGLLVWALGVVVTAAFLGSATSSITSGAGTLAAGTAAVGAAANMATLATPSAAARPESDAGTPASGPQAVAPLPSAYLSDALVRRDATAQPASPATRQELGRILAEALRQGRFSDADRTYAAQVVATQTGLSQADAEKRVDAVYAQGKNMAANAEATALLVADNARKAAAWTSLWIFVALLVGAFCASIAATIGGRQRDRSVGAHSAAVG